MITALCSQAAAFNNTVSSAAPFRRRQKPLFLVKQNHPLFLRRNHPPGSFYPARRLIHNRSQAAPLFQEIRLPHLSYSCHGSGRPLPARASCLSGAVGQDLHSSVSILRMGVHHASRYLDELPKMAGKKNPVNLFSLHHTEGISM